MPYFNKKTDKLGKVFEKIELKNDKAFGITNLVDVAKREGFHVPLNTFKYKKIARGEKK